MSSRIILVCILVFSIYFFDLTRAIGEGYPLKISHPDGSYFRQESVIPDAEGNPQVEGEVRQIFSEPHSGTFTHLYKTGSKEFRVQYSFEKSSMSKLAKNDTFSIKRLGVNALKSTAG
ncbi:uncharacterized protein LOC128252398 [Drosophila gunungcola]|uniref:Uncharacterized protein n=1 Tax=Drosophila gunungcola TaxID=103775 RepID=A0A9P9Z0Y0_9MUSC|nr:uncharacterized protein LOC128252398 [Drosophila gunungcola]KAI8046765.1 hypothetical protein M5D96_002978 [Drosophila gunungcola]